MIPSWDDVIERLDAMENAQDKARLLKRLMMLTYVRDNAAHQCLNMIKRIDQERRAINEKKMPGMFEGFPLLEGAAHE